MAGILKITVMVSSNLRNLSLKNDNLMTTRRRGVPNRTAFSTQEGLRTRKSGITCRRWQFYSYQSKILSNKRSPNTLPWEDTKNWIRHALLSRQVSFWFVHVPLVSWRVKSNGSVKGSILGHLIQISELENMNKGLYNHHVVTIWRLLSFTQCFSKMMYSFSISLSISRRKGTSAEEQVIWWYLMFRICATNNAMTVSNCYTLKSTTVGSGNENSAEI